MRKRSREALAELIEREGVSDPRIVAAFREIDREDFVPEDRRAGAYDDRPVALPHEQTTSQPSLIARMIDAASVGYDDRVLEVGTGYGFQTALLAGLAGEVYSIERFARLAATARRNLEHAGIDNAHVVVGDGWNGYAPAAPYQAIVVSAAAPRLPEALAEQLDEGGRLVIPLEGALGDEVWLLVKESGEVVRHHLVAPARFVPLVPGREPET